LTPLIIRRCLSGVLVGLLGLSAGGCGLDGYEARMAEAQQRLDLFDRENKELAGPLEMPEAVRKYAEDVFLRVPKGVSTTADTGSLVSGLFYRYAGNKDITALYVAWAGEKEKGKEFADKVYGASTFSNPVRKVGPPQNYPTVPSPGREALTLSATTYELREHTYYVYLDPNRKVALVFEISKNALAKTATDTVHLSLGTLALGSAASKQAKEYRERTKGTKK
jgi:hypothetical protein